MGIITIKMLFFISKINVLSLRPEGRGILCPAVPRALVFGRLLGQSCSHGEHIKCSPARAELAINLMPLGLSRPSRVLSATHRTGLSE